ncbi:MAG TPA: SDR family oxidoreductase [Polyangiales bacterium]
MDSSQQYILISGCSSGFGKLLAETLLLRGHHVAAAMRDPADSHAAAATDLNRVRTSGSLTLLDIDVASDASVERAIAQLATRFPRLDALVNNAGISAMGLNEGFTTEQVRGLFEVNTLGAQRMNRAALPLMKPHGRGLLVHVSTGLARMPMPCFGLYAASKAALETIAESYRYELAPLGIDSVIVEPGPYPTQLGERALAPQDDARLAPYGFLRDLPAQMMKGLAAMFAGEHAPNPREVVDAIVQLIEAAPGTRPLRTVIGGGGGALEQLNALTDRLQAELLGAQGLDVLLKVKTGL